MASANFYPVTLNDEGFVRGPGRLLIAAVTQAFPTEISQIVNASTFVAMTGWTDLGATKGGVTITANNTEETFNVDQVLSDIDSLPTGWTMAVSTQLAEMTLDRLAVVFDGDPVTTNAATTTGVSEKNLNLGAPLTYTRRRLAVAFRRPATGKIRIVVFRRVQRSPQEAAVTYNSTGEQQTVAARFNCLADLSVANQNARIGLIFDQL